MRSERSLLSALAEMYVQGISTSKAKAITKELCGVDITAMQVSRAAAKLDTVLQEWRERPLVEINICFCMPVMKKSEKQVKCKMQLF